MPTEHCPHCGASMKKYFHKMLPIRVSALIKFKQAIYHHQRNEIHLKKDMDGLPFQLGRYERSNWTQIRFHGLVAKVRRQDGSHKRGYWLLTRKGRDFLRGEIQIADEVEVFRNRVIGRSENMVTITDVMKSVPYVEDLQDLHYSYADAEDVEKVRAIKKRKGRKKKGQRECPVCGDELKRHMDTEPSEESNAIKVKVYWKCQNQHCAYREEGTL